MPVDKLFPLDVERALKSLDKLGRGNIIWYNANQEPIQQLTSGAVTLAAAFHGRVLLANKAGADLGFTPDYCCRQRQLLLRQQRVGEQAGGDAVPQLHADRQSGRRRLHEATAYAIPNTAALPLVPKEIQDILPTNPAMRDKVFIKNDAWWAANLDKTVQRFKEWQLAG